jgi:hypothetical protein
MSRVRHQSVGRLADKDIPLRGLHFGWIIRGPDLDQKRVRVDSFGRNVQRQL